MMTAEKTAAQEQRVARARVLLALSELPLQPRHIMDDVSPQVQPMSRTELWEIVASLQQERMALPAATAAGAIGFKVTERGVAHLRQLVQGLLAEGCHELPAALNLPEQPGRLPRSAPAAVPAERSRWFTRGDLRI